MKRNKARIESRHKALVEKSSKDILIECKILLIHLLALEDLDSDGKKHNYDLRFNGMI